MKVTLKRQKKTCIYLIVLAGIVVTINLFINGCSANDDSDETTVDTDTTAPTISSVSPMDGSTDVAIASAITAAFSETIDTSTMTTNTTDASCSGSMQLSLDDFSTCIKISADPSADNENKSFTVASASSLLSNKTYKARITTDVKDPAGNSLAQTYSWSFTTVNDITAPTLSSVSPTDTSTDVAISVSITATFSEAMTKATITANTVDTSCSGSLQLSADDFNTCVIMSADPSSDSEELTFTITPTSSLSYSTAYKATITTDAKDLAGNSLAQAYSWSFTTVAETPVTSSPNDDTLNSLRLGNTVFHQIAANGTVYYSIQPDSAGVYKVNVNSSSNLDLYLYSDSSLSILISSTTYTRSKEEFLFNELEYPAVYYLKVEEKAGRSGEFSLRVAKQTCTMNASPVFTHNIADPSNTLFILPPGMVSTN